MRKLLLTLGIAVLVVNIGTLHAEIFGGIDFPGGASSFADFVIQFDPLYNGGPPPTDPSYTNPNESLGPPDYVPPSGSVSLGRGGLLEIAFTDNLLTNSGDPSPDLHIFEVGPDIEDTFVAIRPTPATHAILGPAFDANADGFYEVGKVFGSTSSLDIDVFFPPFPPGTLQFDAVQLVDDPFEGGTSGATVGADIDSVGAIQSQLIPCYPDLPDPILVPAGMEDYVGSGGGLYTRYLLNVENWDQFPDELFTPAPDLPPCGLNNNASRTWVNIYDAADDSYVYGFCGLSSAASLNGIWFGIPRGEVPPCVYITLTDRRCELTYTSNVVCFPYEASIDIKPGSCPNPFNAKSKGSVPVAIVGTPFLDVTRIDPNSITLTSPSGEVVAALPQYVIIDSTQADDGDPNDCFACFDADDPANYNCDLWDALTDPSVPPVPGTDGIMDSYCGDGYPDLVVKFDTRELADAIGRVPRDTCVELFLDGMLVSGQPIYGSDSVLTRKK